MRSTLAIRAPRPRRSTPSRPRATKPAPLRHEGVQTKLQVSRPGDRLETEADRIAAQVMSLPDTAHGTTAPAISRSAGPGAQRLCETCEDEVQRQASEEEEEEMVQAKRDGGSALAPDLDTRFGSLGSGQPLSRAERSFFEPRFDEEFADVRIHSNREAAQASASIQALAFTRGSHICFGEGQYRPQSRAGRELLAHELTHVVQQRGGSRNAPATATPPTAGGRHAPISAASGAPALQRACGTSQIGPSDCPGESNEPVGELVLFNVNCDTYASAADEQRVKDFADAMLSTDTVTVHGFASIDGDPDFNLNLSCARARTAEDTLLQAGVPQRQIDVRAHGPTPGPADQRRSVVLELGAPQSRQPTPQLRARVTTAPTPGTCGDVRFVIDWEISRNSGADGGWVVQNIFITWSVLDCTGSPVPHTDPRTSPLHYFEAWRVLPNSQTFVSSTDNFVWVDNLPWGGTCTDGVVSFIAVAHYHDNVSNAAMPAHMTARNPATFAGGLRSSLTDPALGGQVSRPVPHQMTLHWFCCPCSSSPTVVDSHIP